MKSPNFQKFNGEICTKLQNFLKTWSIKINFGQNMCQKFVWFLSYVIFKIRFWILPWKYSDNLSFFWFFLKMELTPCKAEQPLQGMELQEKEAQKD